MKMPKLYLLSKGKSSQIDLIYYLAAEFNIKSFLIDIYDYNHSITLNQVGIIIDGETVISPAIFYQYGLSADYLTVPDYTDNRKNWTYFQDSQPILEQLNSQALSLMSYATQQKGCITINNPVDSFDLKSRLIQYKTLKSLGLNTPEFILTNSLSALKITEIYNNSDNILWSYPDSDSPIKSLKKINLNKLLNDKTDIPYLFMSQVSGTEVRAWFLDDKPLLACSIKNPEYDVDSTEMLEKFTYHKPGKSLYNLGESLKKHFKGFFEMHGIIDENGDLTIYNIDLVPDFMYLGSQGQKYLACEFLISLLEKFNINVENKAELPETESRIGVFLGRMLESLFAAEGAN
ncbi:MAG: hypothetical protein RO257_16845 [Candidatus Kapabacteria bacterium]|nr:hypothetical protein [Candidatus Kapabacteria bacterium]